LPPLELDPLLPDDDDELDEDDELELDEDELLDPLVVLVIVPLDVEVEVPPLLVEVEEPVLPVEEDEVELPVLPVVELSILISTRPPPLELPPKNPPKKPPKPPPKPLDPPITIGVPPPPAITGAWGGGGSGIGTIAYSCSHSSWHSRSITRRTTRWRGGTVRWARRCLTYLMGWTVSPALAEW
jgi:hypothetical protein